MTKLYRLTGSVGSFQRNLDLSQISIGIFNRVSANISRGSLHRRCHALNGKIFIAIGSPSLDERLQLLLADSHHDLSSKNSTVLCRTITLDPDDNRTAIGHSQHHSGLGAAALSQSFGGASGDDPEVGQVQVAQ